MVRIIHNRLLGGWYIVRGPHQTPIGGRFDSRAAAQAHLERRDRDRLIADVEAQGWPQTAAALRTHDSAFRRVRRSIVREGSYE